MLAVLDDTDYRLAEEAARQQLVAATTQARQAESDRHRLNALKSDGSVSVSDDEKAQSGAQTASATAEAEARKLELARNRLKYTVLRASQSGVVTAVRFEVGQVVAEGQPIVSIANEGEPEIVADVPEDHLAVFKTSRYKAWLASAPEQTFEVALRELSPQAAAQTRTFRARLKPVTPRPLPLGATATLVVERQVGEAPAAVIPASAITQNKGQPAVWVVRRAGTEPVATVDLIKRRRCTGIATTRCSCRGRRPVSSSSPPACKRWRRACGSRFPGPRATPKRSRPPDEIVQPHRMGAEPPRHRSVPDPRDRHRRRAGLHEARPARRPELLGAVDDGDGHLARRDGATGPGRGAQPHGEEVRAARPLREGQDLCAPGLRRHDASRSSAAPRMRTSARRGTRRARSSATSSSSCPKASSARSSTTNTAT